jgi:hypothetical protein
MHRIPIQVPQTLNCPSAARRPSRVLSTQLGVAAARFREALTMRPFIGICALLTAAVALEGFVLFPSNWIGTYGQGVVTQPIGIAVAPDGSSYVADAWTNRIEKFSKAGTHLLGWGVVGGGPGQFQGPTGVALAPSGEVYVLEVNSGRVQRFTSQGAYVGEFGSAGTGPGQFESPHALAIDAAGNVYVADTYNHRVQKFTAGGAYVAQWGVQGSGNGQLNLPYGIAVDTKGDVYVGDTYNHRIQKFTGSGVYLDQWGGLGSGAGQFEFPNGVAVDAGGSVYVADTNNHRIQRFTSKGVLLANWGNQGNGAGDFQFPQGVAIGPDEDLHVSDTANNRVQRFRRRNGAGHESVLTMGGPGIGNGQFSDPRGVAVSKDGFVYAADKTGCRMQKFTTAGTWVLAWGASGSADGQFNDPCGVALDTSGVVYVVDHLNGRVEKFSPTGTFLGKWGVPGTGPGQFTAPWDIAIDDSNRVYVVDAHRIQRFTTAGGFVTAWACSNAAGIGVDAEGSVYAACSSDHVVRKYRPDGTLVLTWGSSGNGVAQFGSVSDVACDPRGSVYVVDSNCRVQQFTPMGGYLEEWGEPGSGFREIGAPTMMAADAGGNVYVAEFTNRRLHKFASPPEIYKIEDVPGDEGGSVRISFVPTSVPPEQILFYRVLRFNDAGGVNVGTFAPGPTSVVVASGGNATDTFAGMSEYDLIAALSIPNAFPAQSLAFGFSTDDLAPPAPAPFTGSYQAGATWLHWGASPATDLAEYRVFRSLPPYQQIHASPDTGYADVGPAGGFYRIVAVDTSGNVSGPSDLGPEQTVDAPAGPALAFALQGAVPNPAAGAAMTLRFTLPDALPARLELVSVAGRTVWSREVRGAGAHALRPDVDCAPGIYFVRLVRPGGSLVRRAVVLD